MIEKHVETVEAWTRRSDEARGCVFVGRLSDEKGLRTLINVWRTLQEDSPSSVVAGYTLFIVGDGDKREEYETLARGLSIKFLGQRSHDEVMDLIAHAKCLIQPSVCWETFGMGVVEAMSVGTPAIVSDLGALPSVVGDAGMVFPAGNVEALADAIRMMLTCEDYDARCTRARCRAAEVYSESANVKRLIGIYNENPSCT